MTNTRIRDYLANGLTPLQVKNIVGCSAEYLKALLEDEEFKASVQAKAAEVVERADEEKILSDKRLSVEHLLLKQIEAMAQTAEMRDVVNAYKVVSDSQAKAAERANPVTQAPVAIVNITLPVHAVPNYVINGTNEVVSIGDKPLAPLPSSAVKELLLNRTKEVNHVPA